MRDIRTIRVGARVYTLVWDGELAEELGEASSPEATGSCYGVVAHVDRKIILAPDYNKTPDGAFETLLHECIHIIEPFLGQTIDHDTLDAVANLLASLLIQSKIVDPRELSLAGVPLAGFRGKA